MAEEEKKTSNKNNNKNNNKDVKKKKNNNNKKNQKNVEKTTEIKNETAKKDKNNMKAEEVKEAKKTEEVEVVEVIEEKETNNDEFEIKQTITTKKANTGLKIVAAIILLAIVCLAGLYIKFVVIDKNTIGEVTRALMNTLSPKEKLYEAIENSHKEKNIEQTFSAKITKFDSNLLGENLVNLLGKKELEETIKGLELKATAKKDDKLLSLDGKLDYNEKSIISAELYQEIGKEGVARFFGDGDLVVKLPKAAEIDSKKIEEYMIIVKELKKTYDSKYSDIIKYIDENIFKIEEKDGVITLKTSFEQIRSSLKGLLLKIKENPEFITDTYNALDRIVAKLKETGDYVHLGLTEKAIESYAESIKEIIKSTTPEGIKKDIDEVIEELKGLDNIKHDVQVELEFTLKDSKISKVLTKVEVDKSLKVETTSEFKYGNVKVEKFQYNEEALSDEETTYKNVTTKATMQIFSLPIAQKLIQSFQGGAAANTLNNSEF